MSETTNGEYPIGVLPTDPEDIFDWAARLSKRVAEIAAIRREHRKQLRRDSYRRRKSLGLLKKRPTKAEIEAEEERARKDLREGEDRQAREYATTCTCFLGHPPCSFCETYNPDEESQP
jgi:hypothetical protein